MRTLIIKLLKSTVLFFLTFSVFANTFKIAYNEDWPPYSYVENKKMKGLLINLVDEIINKRMGINVQNQGFPWKRVQKKVSIGLVDAFITVPTEARLKYTESSENVIYTIEMKSYISKTSPALIDLKAINSPEQLRAFRICEIFGNGWGENFLKKNAIEYHLAPTVQNCLQMVSKGRMDLIIQSVAVGSREVRRLNLKNKIQMLPHSYGKMEFTLMVSKKSVFYQNFIPK